jgi:alpha-tubulin suppressor-like RCC1 family protein
MSESDVWSCILRRGGTVACHDDENRWGETGDGPLGFRGPHYADVTGLTDVARVDVGYDHACAVKTTGTVWCWGNDDQGQVSGKGVGKFRDAADVVGLAE